MLCQAFTGIGFSTQHQALNTNRVTFRTHRMEMYNLAHSCNRRQPCRPMDQRHTLIDLGKHISSTKNTQGSIPCARVQTAFGHVHMHEYCSCSDRRTHRQQCTEKIVQHRNSESGACSMKLHQHEDCSAVYSSFVVLEG